MYVVNGSDGRCLVAVRLIVGVRYLERPLREVLLYLEARARRLTTPTEDAAPSSAPMNGGQARSRIGGSSPRD